ncbi:hypothetical protein [Dyadobacter tibetensis]|uniref:hypothetical protein n=1 Tax=Dyadobacter tibetensis TaxID=1211851 RepID=UPI000472C65F|nr:hypothetical protein [Dyadobacter tibetensis]
MNTPLTPTPPIYALASSYRGEDQYLPHMPAEEIIADFFPESFSEVVFKLSNATSSFYGLMLKAAGEKFGYECMEELSKATTYALGQKTAKQMLILKPSIERNAKGIAKISIASIFRSSPEYIFQFLKYEEHLVEIRFTGIDRYHRICRELGIEQYISPPIDAYIQGINDALHLPYQICMEIESISENSICSYKLSFKL